MKPHQTVTIVALLSLAALTPAVAQQNTDQLKQRVLAQAQSLSAEDYAFTRTVHSEATLFGKKTKVVRTEKYDPTKPTDARWALVSVNGAPPSAAELRKYRKGAAKRRVVPGYYRVANYFGAPASVAGDAEGKTLFRFATLPKGSVSIQGADLSQLASAEAAVTDADGTPFVEQVSFTLKPQRPKVIAGVDRYETTFRYRLGADGKPLLTETTADLFGSGLGLEATMHMEATYSDYQPVRNPARP